MMDTNWLILGGGGHARSLLDVIERISPGDYLFVTPEGKVPEWAPRRRSRGLRQSALTKESGLHRRWLLAVGANSVRATLLARAHAFEADLSALVATSATVAPDAHLGPGVVVLEHAHVGPGAFVGAGVIVNTAAVVEHDSQVGACAHIAPRAALLGSVTVGSGTLIGAGATVLPDVVVGENVILGAGAVAVDDIPNGITAVGQPARPAPV